MSKLEFTRGEIIAQKYEVVDVLEESPLGITYRVKHQKSGKFVRLTMLRPKVAGRDQKNQLLDVYRRVKDLANPAIVKIGELGENEGLAYFTAEDFEGQTLRELITQQKVEGKQLEMKEAAQVAHQILEGLDAMHKEGFYLRGLRPEYVLVNVRRTGPRNANFVARVKIVGSGFWDLVPAGVLAEDEFARGEAQYLAPEMKSFEPIASPRADIYSVGVMFYEMLTGVAPLGTFQMPAQIRPDLPKFVNDIVELALANSPEDRYQSCADFMAAIQRTMSNDAVDDGDKRGPRLLPILFGGFVLLSAIIALLLLLRPDPDGPRKAAQAADVELRNKLKAEVQANIPPKAELEAIMARHPPGMAYIPKGHFALGRMNWDENALSSEPLAQETETPAYLIDKYEYPNKAGAVPMRDVDYAEADKLCQDQGKRLCTDVEWERACKGLLNSIYGYNTEIPSDTFDPSFCGDGIADRGYPSGSMAGCKTNGYGVYDMSGNFREWTGSAPNGKDSRRVVKGGYPNNSERGTRCAFTTDEAVGFKDSAMSFRCCRDAEAPPWTPPPPVPAAPVPPTAPPQ